MVLKRAGDALGAAQAMEEARLLDGQDRFLNGKAAKYWLRAGEVKRAEELVAMFTKVSTCPGPLGDLANGYFREQKDSPPVTDLTDLQCLWFLEEEARAYRRNGNLGLALKRYHALISVSRLYNDD
jgi:peptide alpha-N-acetyltransferase